jgi:hypothetical protein
MPSAEVAFDKSIENDSWPSVNASRWLTRSLRWQKLRAKSPH